MGSIVLDTTVSDTGTVIEFGQVNKYDPETVVFQLDIASGDTITLYGKIATLDYDVIATLTESGFKTFLGLPDTIRFDRTTDGGSGDSKIAMT